MKDILDNLEVKNNIKHLRDISIMQVTKRFSLNKVKSLIYMFR